MSSMIFILLSFLIRTANKKFVIEKNIRASSKKRICLFASRSILNTCLKEINDTAQRNDFIISMIILPEGDIFSEEDNKIGIPVYEMSDEAISHIIHDWIDELFIFQTNEHPFSETTIEMLLKTGIPVNLAILSLSDDYLKNIEIKTLGNFRVLHTGKRLVNPEDLFLKRLLDIIGSALGCILTCIISVFIAPAIYLSDPGPVIFTQTRVGQNGKKFTIHKFRSMYQDAEKRKQEYMKHNEIKNDFMFKMKNDPRIIGAGEKFSIGNFIRKTSIDEFPQFFDVLAGKMSLVGWRPCTLDEWEKYGIDHRVRASMKPGLTGMWQVCGRSSIKDFSEVVRLDMEYIENWSILLDIKILIKTIGVVLTCKGAE